MAGAGTEVLQGAGYPTLAPKNGPTLDDSVVYYENGYAADAVQIAELLGLEPTQIEPMPSDPGVPIEDANVIAILGSTRTTDRRRSGEMSIGVSGRWPATRSGSSREGSGVGTPRSLLTTSSSVHHFEPWKAIASNVSSLRLGQRRLLGPGHVDELVLIEVEPGEGELDALGPHHRPHRPT